MTSWRDNTRAAARLTATRRINAISIRTEFAVRRTALHPTDGPNSNRDHAPRSIPTGNRSCPAVASGPQCQRSLPTGEENVIYNRGYGLV